MEKYLGISSFSSRVQQNKQLRAQSCQVFESLLPPHVLIKLPSVAPTPLAKAEVVLKSSEVFWVRKWCSSLQVTSRGFLSWGWVIPSKDVCRDELSLPLWPCCYTRPVWLSPAPGAFEGRCEGECRDPGHENNVCASSSSLLGIKLIMPATLFSLVLKRKAIFGIGRCALIWEI